MTINSYAECRYAECHYAECRGAGYMRPKHIQTPKGYVKIARKMFMDQPGYKTTKLKQLEEAADSITKKGMDLFSRRRLD